MFLPNSESNTKYSGNGVVERLFSYEIPASTSELFRRKGGGGHGGGHGSSHGSSGKGGSSSKGSPASSHGASSTFTSSRGASGFSISKSGKTTTTATAYSSGGGKRVTLGSDTPFSGRQAGGGDRSTIYGTSRFGSGYPYGDYGYYVDLRPFPYVFYPVPPSRHYYGGDEYLNVNETQRPGGNIVSAIVQPSWNASSVTYRLLGDNNSVTAVFDALVANCSAANSSSAITAYTPSSDTWPLPEQIIQYYRASTFALSLDGYNNTASLPANMPADNDTAPLPLSQDTPLPAGLNNTFLVCVNTTIGASVPLEDIPSHKLTPLQIKLVVAASIMGFIILTGICCCAESCCSKRKRRKGVKASPKSSESSIEKVTLEDRLAELRAVLNTKRNEAHNKGTRWPRTPFTRHLGYRAVRPDANNLPEAVKHEEQENDKGASSQEAQADKDGGYPPRYSEVGFAMPGSFEASQNNDKATSFPKPIPFKGP